jgi:hypothetical protein
MHPSMAIALAVVFTGAIVTLFARQPRSAEPRLMEAVARPAD